MDHKLPRLHQIRYGVDITPYGLAWNVSGLMLLLARVGLAARAARRGAAGPAG